MHGAQKTFDENRGTPKKLKGLKRPLIKKRGSPKKSRGLKDLR
jgi:hypothetical protein